MLVFITCIFYVKNCCQVFFVQLLNELTKVKVVDWVTFIWYTLYWCTYSLFLIKNKYFSKEDATFKIKSGETSEKKEENVLRLRKTVDNESASNEKAKTNKIKEPLDKNDPIFWFGILLPNSLHQAREKFLKGFKIKL